MHKRFILSFLVVLLLDQLSKYWAAQAGLVVLNTGISFGFLESSWLIWVLLMGLGIVGSWFVVKNRLQQRFPILYGAIAGGAVSNVLDRLLLGGVQDWLPILGLSITNNIADWVIVGGLGISLVLEYTRGKNQNEA